MTTYRGLDGFLVLGGILTGTPKLRASYATGASEVAVTGAGATLTGLVAVGDTFTITGETGTPTHTITGSFYDCTGNSPGTLTFSTSLAAAVVTGATLNFDSNAVTEVRLHGFSSQVLIVPDTVLGDAWDTQKVMSAGWTGRGEMNLDHDDARQAEVLDSLASATPSPSLNAVVFGIADDKLWYGQVVVSGFAITLERDNIVTVTFDVTGTGSIRPEWV